MFPVVTACSNCHLLIKWSKHYVLRFLMFVISCLCALVSFKIFRLLSLTIQGQCSAFFCKVGESDFLTSLIIIQESLHMCKLFVFNMHKFFIFNLQRQCLLYIAIASVFPLFKAFYSSLSTTVCNFKSVIYITTSKRSFSLVAAQTMSSE